MDEEIEQRQGIHNPPARPIRGAENGGSFNNKSRFEPNDPLDEAQASIRAARFAPDLTRKERYLLLRDAIDRLSNRGIRIREVRKILDITER